MKKLNYSGTTPYSQPVNMATSLLQPLYSCPNKLRLSQNFLIQRTPFYMTTLLVTSPDFCDLLVTRLMGFQASPWCRRQSRWHKKTLSHKPIVFIVFLILLSSIVFYCFMSALSSTQSERWVPLYNITTELTIAPKALLPCFLSTPLS